MKFGRILLTLALAIGLNMAAEAKTTHLGLLSDGDARSSHGRVHKGTLTFSDTVTFRLASESSIADIFTALKGITTFTVSLFLNGSKLDSFSGGPGGNPSGATSHTFTDLAASTKGQHYSLLINGTGKGGATYFNALSVQAVPEADTWLMLIAGVALVAFQLRRKQNSLPQRSIN